MAANYEIRRYDIDRLRVFAVLMVFLHHCNCIFAVGDDYHLQNSEQFMAFNHVVAVFETWLMPFFFLLSGAGSAYALKHRTWSAYVWDRTKRLLVPLYTVGMLLFAVPIYYWQEITRGNFAGSYLEFYPYYFDKFLGKGFFSLSFSLSHLWFLYSLFFMSVILLPLMIYLKGDGGKKIIGRLGTLCLRRGGVFIFIIPIWLLKSFLGITFNSNFNWPEQFHYMLYFLFGYVMIGDKRFEESFKRDWSLGIFIAFSGYAIMVVALTMAPEIMEMIKTGNYSLPGLLFVSAMTTLICWGIVIALLGLGAKYLNYNSPALGYANEAVLPFYIMHHTAIIGVAFYVIQTGWPVWMKYSMIALPAFALILGAYEILVRRWNPVRVLFGMRLKNAATG